MSAILSDHGFALMTELPPEASERRSVISNQALAQVEFLLHALALARVRAVLDFLAQ